MKNQLSRLRQLIQKASFSSSSDRHSALEIVDELGQDSERLNYLDGNAKLKMGWRVAVAPAGNVSITSVVQLGKPITTIREAIDAAVNVADITTTIRLCEFSGDEHHDHDEAGYKKLCSYAGFHHCTLHNEPLTFTEDGWRVCVAQCTKPIQVKDVNMSRNLLHKSKLLSFIEWLDAKGITHRPPRGDYQVLQVWVSPNWCVIYDRLAAPEHYTVDHRMEHIVRRFIQESRK